MPFAASSEATPSDNGGLLRFTYDLPSSRPRPELLDQTLRDGLQSPSVRQPSLEVKCELLRLMVEVGVTRVDVGMPSSSPRAWEDAAWLVRRADEERLRLTPIVSGRMSEVDLQAIVSLCERVGHPVTSYLFFPTSAIRARAEGWSEREVESRLAPVLGRGNALQLPMCFVAEDASRTEPGRLLEILSVALDCGASRICLCDTAGALMPAGAVRLVELVREHLARRSSSSVELDWHGHDDRGLGLATALAACEAGVGVVHATALGEGERAGNTALELVIANWVLSGLWPHECLAAVGRYTTAMASALGISVSPKHPVVGRDAFRTATGVHARAIQKASLRGESEVADLVYSSIPAALLGRSQEICMGACSGHANARHWLYQHGIELSTEETERLLAFAKSSDHVLSDQELFAWLAQLPSTSYQSR